MEISFFQVKTLEEIEIMCEIARIIWHETYDEIIGPEQAEYMIQKFQSPQAVAEQQKNLGYCYYMIVCDQSNAGFVGISPRYEKKEKMFLSKIYLLSQFRGHGAVKKAFELVEEQTKQEGLPSIWLTVNKNNLHAIEVYQHFGFVKVDAVVSDIGNGYVMDDYVMEKTV